MRKQIIDNFSSCFYLFINDFHRNLFFELQIYWQKLLQTCHGFFFISWKCIGKMRIYHLPGPAIFSCNIRIYSCNLIWNSSITAAEFFLFYFSLWMRTVGNTVGDTHWVQRLFPAFSIAESWHWMLIFFFFFSVHASGGKLCW